MFPSCNFYRPIISTAWIVILFTMKNILKGLNGNVMTTYFCASGWLYIHCQLNVKTFSSETPVIFGAIYFEREEQTKSHWWLMKLQLKFTAIMYGNFCSLDLCLLWQSNTEYTMAFQAWRIKLWKMKCSYENGAKKMYESLSATKIFLKFEML